MTARPRSAPDARRADPVETPGERLHRLISVRWGPFAPVDPGGDFSALGDTAARGWEEIASRFLAEASREEPKR